MYGFVDIVNFALAVSGLTISFLGLILSLNIRFTDKWTKRFFTVMFTILTAYITSDLLSQISLVILKDGHRTLAVAAIFLESFLSSLLMPLLTVFLLHTCGESLKCRLFYSIGALWLVYVLLLTATQFTDKIYYVSDDNVYSRGPAYPVLLVPPVLIMLVNLTGLISRKDNLSKKEKTSFMLYLLIPMVSMLLQMFSYGILLIVLSSSISALIMFVFIVSEITDKFLAQEIKLSHQSLKTAALQMRPHFIYNTMTSIYYLCDLNPQKAKSVIEDFTAYLKKNFSAIVKEGLIPFDEELEHTRAFLTVVKARYEDLLFVEYDTPHHSFFVPPLTLEPIVENAVKHALDPDLEPLHIFIKTRQLPDKSLIIVENTGIDFTMTDDRESSENNNEFAIKTDSEPHIGLANVKSRLRFLCGGTISIERREGGGTVVTITIPKQ